MIYDEIPGEASRITESRNGFRFKAQFKTEPFSESQVNVLLDTWAQQIRMATIEAASTHSDALSLSQWESAMQALKSQLIFARSN